MESEEDKGRPEEERGVSEPTSTSFPETPPLAARICNCREDGLMAPTPSGVENEAD
jgi:hypothetical protein